jgi:hypothetical protein
MSPSFRHNGGVSDNPQKWQGRFSRLILVEHFHITRNRPVIRINDGFEEAHKV